MKKILLTILFITLSFNAWAIAVKNLGNADKITVAAVDPSTTASSEPFPIEKYLMGNVQVVWSDHTNTSTFELQWSSDGTNYDTVTGSSTTTSGTSGSVNFDLDRLAGLLLRVTVTGTNGDASAALTPTFVGKGKR